MLIPGKNKTPASTKETDSPFSQLAVSLMTCEGLGEAENSLSASTATSPAQGGNSSFSVVGELKDEG